MSLQDMMEGFEGAPMGGGGNYLEEGSYLLKILEVKNGHAEQGGFNFFLVEFEVLASDNPKFKPHTRAEWMVPFKKPQYKKTYQADVKQFLYHAIKGHIDPNVTPEAINGQVWAFATSTQQPLAGKYVAATAFKKPMKHSPGETFTKTNFQVWQGPGASASNPVGQAQTAA